MTSFGTNPAATLKTEQEALLALTGLLEQEQQLLIAANIERIATLTEPKAQAAVRMAELATERYEALTAAGYEGSEAGMKTWLSSQAATPAHNKDWNDLLTMAETAKELNRVNGTLINKQLARNQHALDVLQHGTEHGNPVYGPSGQKTSKSIGRHIIA
ncbi:flagella synthesis protein FlgN [uncultured Oxalicibacterium sp.]|uniref:flagella synthesis protein FlgN n=1 Tax=uncultured Oxalicibacterium sp. TaxID=1168540 RepID=UPI0025E35940|nr:flagellar protein FlgN [uncultured Oxalicibacterium sp.]